MAVTDLTGAKWNNGVGWFNFLTGTASADRSTLVSGTDIPTLENTGVLPGVPRTAHGGSYTISSGGNYENLDFATSGSRVRITTSEPVTFTNCAFTQPGDSVDTCVTIEGASSDSDVTFTDCTFHPTWSAHVADDTTGGHVEAAVGCKISYGSVTFLRCQFLDTADGINIFRGTHDIQQCWIGKSAYWRPDEAGRPEGGHNDGIQFYGDGGSLVRGNYFDGFANTSIGDAQFSEFTGGDANLHGLEADHDPQAWINACIFMQENTIGITNTVIDKNWLKGGVVQIHVSDALGATSGISITDNVFGNEGTDDAGKNNIAIYIGTASNSAATAISGNVCFDGISTPVKTVF